MACLNYWAGAGGACVTLADVPVFLDPSVKALMPDPASLAGMDRVRSGSRMPFSGGSLWRSFGDYDVDGACSSAVMARFLRAHDTPARIYIPDRIFDGYGPNIAALETLVKEGAKLIITVDCGTTSFETMASAKKLSTDILVIDHHQADETLPQ